MLVSRVGQLAELSRGQPDITPVPQLEAKERLAIFFFSCTASLAIVPSAQVVLLHALALLLHLFFHLLRPVND